MSSDTNFTSPSEDAQPAPSRRSFLTRAAGVSAVAVPDPDPDHLQEGPGERVRRS